jgi:hypothetical protein
MSAAFLRLLLSSPAGENNTEAYAFELQEYKDIKKDLPMSGDLITHIVVKTSKMPKWMTFYSTHGWSRMVPVQCVAPEWYLIYFAGGINATNYLQTDGFPQDSKIYINWAFINRVSPRSDNKTGHMFAPPLQPNILSLSHTERMMTMSHITHISWDKNTTGKTPGYCYNPVDGNMYSTYYIPQYDYCPTKKSGSGNPLSGGPRNFNGTQMWFRTGGVDKTYCPSTA